MREIEFRAKRIDNNEWVYGSLIPLIQGDFIVSTDSYNEVEINLHEKLNCNALWEENDFVKVSSETIGQYTGLKDKNGKKIFEGDILEYEFEDIGKQKAYVDWNGKYASFTLEVISEDFEYAPIESGVIIGNIYDNPELIGEEV